MLTKIATDEKYDFMDGWGMDQVGIRLFQLSNGVGSMQGSSEGRLPLKGSSTKGRLPPKVVFHHMSSSTNGCLPLKVVFH